MHQRVYIQETSENWVFHNGGISVTIKCKPSSRITAEALAQEIDLMLIDLHFLALKGRP